MSNKTKSNALKNYAREKGIALWEVADALGLSEATFYRMCRYELPKETADEIISIIDKMHEARMKGETKITAKPNIPDRRMNKEGKARYCSLCGVVFKNGRYLYCPYCASSLEFVKINNGAEEEKVND